MFSNRPIWWRRPDAEPASGRARQIIVTTEVEGSLLEPGGRSLFEQRAGLDFLAAHGIPLVINSHRTRAEIERLHQRFDLLAPFISEYGSALFLPHGCFPFVPDRTQPALGGEVIEFGKRYQDVVDGLRLACRESGVRVVGFSELTIDEVARELGITTVEAQLVKLREYTELIRIVEHDDAALGRLVSALRRQGLQCIRRGGHYLVSATPDPAESLRTLRALWRLTWGDHVVIGLGHSEDDVAWLEHVDVPVIIPNQRAKVPVRALPKLPAVHVTKWPGRQGWSEAIFEHVGTLLTPRANLVVANAEGKAWEQ